MGDRSVPPMTLANAFELDISRYAPKGAVTINLKVTIKPASGAVLIYSPITTEPIWFNGPVAQKDVPLDGSKIYFQLIRGATDCKIIGSGYRLK